MKMNKTKLLAIFAVVVMAVVAVSVFTFSEDVSAEGESTWDTTGTNAKLTVGSDITTISGDTSNLEKSKAYYVSATSTTLTVPVDAIASTPIVIFVEKDSQVKLQSASSFTATEVVVLYSVTKAESVLTLSTTASVDSWNDANGKLAVPATVAAWNAYNGDSRIAINAQSDTITLKATTAGFTVIDDDNGLDYYAATGTFSGTGFSTITNYCTEEATWTLDNFTGTIKSDSSETNKAEFTAASGTVTISTDKVMTVVLTDGSIQVKKAAEAKALVLSGEIKASKSLTVDASQYAKISTSTQLTIKGSVTNSGTIIIEESANLILSGSERFFINSGAVTNYGLITITTNNNGLTWTDDGSAHYNDTFSGYDGLSGKITLNITDGITCLIRPTGDISIQNGSVCSGLFFWGAAGAYNNANDNLVTYKSLSVVGTNFTNAGLLVIAVNNLTIQDCNFGESNSGIESIIDKNSTINSNFVGNATRVKAISYDYYLDGSSSMGTKPLQSGNGIIHIGIMSGALTIKQNEVFAKSNSYSAIALNGRPGFSATSIQITDNTLSGANSALHLMFITGDGETQEKDPKTIAPGEKYRGNKTTSVIISGNEMEWAGTSGRALNILTTNAPADLLFEINNNDFNKTYVASETYQNFIAFNRDTRGVGSITNGASFTGNKLNDVALNVNGNILPISNQYATYFEAGQNVNSFASGPIVIFGSANITSASFTRTQSMEVGVSAELIISGTLTTNGGALINNGTITIVSTGKIVNNTAFTNNGIVNNAGTINSKSDSALTNTGTVNNTGTLGIEHIPTFTLTKAVVSTNGGSVVMYSSTDGSFTTVVESITAAVTAESVVSSFEYGGTNAAITITAKTGKTTLSANIYNGWNLNVEKDATVLIPAAASVSNAGTITNAGKINCEASSTLTNTGVINNTGTLGIEHIPTFVLTNAVVSSNGGSVVMYSSTGGAFTTPAEYITAGASSSFEYKGTNTTIVITAKTGTTTMSANVYSGWTLDVKSGATLTIPEEGSVTINTNAAAVTLSGTLSNAGTLIDQKGCTNAGTITNSGLFQIEKACINNGTITNTGEIAFIMSPGVGYSIPGATGITTSGETGAINWYNEAKAVSNLTYFIKSGESGSFKMTGTSGTAITTAFTAGAANQINLTVASGCTMSVANGVKVTVPAGKQLEVLGTLTNNGTVNVVGTLSDSYAINQDTQMIVNDGTIEVAATGILKVGCNISADVNIDGTIIINAGGTFKNKTTGENILVANNGSPAIKLTEGSVKIVASDVGKAVDYTLSAGSKATIKESNAPGFGFKSDDTVTIDGELTADEMKIISGVKLTINGVVTVPASKSLVIEGTGTVAISSEGKLNGDGTFDFRNATQGTKVLTVVDGGVLTTILDGSHPTDATKASVMKLVGVVAGANGITVSKGSVVIDGTYTTDDDGTITITSGTATITGTVDEGVKIVVPAGVTVNIPAGGTLEFDAGSSFENSGTIEFESPTSSTIVYEAGSTVNGVEIEVTTKQTEEGIIVAIIITLKTANADKILLKVGGQYFEVFYVEAFEGDSYADALAGIEVESLKSRVSFDGWYNVLNEKVTSGMVVGSVAPTLTAKFTETPREGVTPYTPSIEPTVITVDETGGYDNTTMLVAAVAMLVVAIFVLGYVVIVKKK